MSILSYGTKPSNFAPITVPAAIVMKEGDVLYIENLGTNPLFVKRGLGASTTSFNHCIAAATGADDGTGGARTINDFVGSVTFAGTTPRYMAFKR